MLDQDRADQLRRQLRAIPRLYVYARVALAPGSAPRTLNTRSAAPTGPLPCRLDLLSHLALGAPDLAEGEPGGWPLLTVLGDWATRIAADRAMAGPDSLHPKTLSVYLLRHHRWAIQQDWAATYADQVNDAVRPLYAVAPTRRPVRRGYCLPCPRCHRLTLQETEGDPYITCADEECGMMLTRAEYDDRARQAETAITNAA